MATAVELVFLALAAVRVVTLVAMPAARRELRARPLLTLVLAVAAIAGAALIAWAARHAPGVLHALVVLVGAGWIGGAWRARAAYGRWRGWPPGSLGLRPSLTAIVDPDFYRRAAERHGTIFKMAQFHSPVVCVIGLAAGRDLIRRGGDALEPPALPLSAEVPRGFLRYMTPDDHADYSRIFRAAVSEAALRAIEQDANVVIDAALGALAAASTERGAAGVDPKPVLDRALSDVLLRLYFGGLLQPGDAEVITACQHDASLSGVGRATPGAVAALRRFEQLLLARGARYEVGSDPSIWAGLVRNDAAAAQDLTVIGNLFLMLDASQDSIGGLWLWIVVMLSGAPAWCERTRTSPATDGDEPYARVVLETLRLAQSEYIYRKVTRPITIGSFTVPRGWMVRLCVAESHRLPALFPVPDVFDPDRHLVRRYGPDELAPFGLDHHACLGARMTLLLGRILARRLVEGFAWQVVADGPITRTNRHWRHWEPSPRFRISLRPHVSTR